MCIRDRIDTALDNHGVKNLVFDFTNVSFMDSSGIGMVLGRYRKMGQTEGKIEMCIRDRIYIRSCGKLLFHRNRISRRRPSQ